MQCTLLSSYWTIKQMHVFKNKQTKKTTQKLFRYTLFKYTIKSYASWMNGQLVK